MVNYILSMRKEHLVTLGKYKELKNFFEIEEAKFEAQRIRAPFHVRAALSIIRDTEKKTILG